MKELDDLERACGYVPGVLSMEQRRRLARECAQEFCRPGFADPARAREIARALTAFIRAEQIRLAVLNRRFLGRTT